MSVQRKTMVLPKLVITDIDGVWTDGGMYYDETGNELKRFCTGDSAGVLFLHHLNIPVAIITGEQTKGLARRAKKLKIDHIFQGVRNKVNVAEDLCRELNISLNDVAFIGDDIGDAALLQRVGFSAAPRNAPAYIKRIVMTVVDVSGGDGAFRAFVELILKKTKTLDPVVSFFLNPDRTV